MNRLIKAFWFVTLLATAGLLLFVYAGLYENQQVLLNELAPGLDREVFFYIGLAVIMLVNFTLYIGQWKIRKQDHTLAEFLKGWYMSLGSALNFFLIVVLFFVQVYNGSEKFDYSNFGYLIFISLGIIILCAISLPIFIIKQKIKS